MAFSRTSNDYLHQMYVLQQNAAIEEYNMRPPDNGPVHFMSDPNIRMGISCSNWAPTNNLEIEANLMGLNRRARDSHFDLQTATPFLALSSTTTTAPTSSSLHVDRSRTLTPAWTLRDTFLQEGMGIGIAGPHIYSSTQQPLQTNISTRLMTNKILTSGFVSAVL